MEGPYTVEAFGNVRKKAVKREAIRLARKVARNARSAETVSVKTRSGALVYQCHWNGDLRTVIVEEL